MVPAEWEESTLGAVAEFVNGDRSENYPKQADYAYSGVPFINTGHIDPSGAPNWFWDELHHQKCVRSFEWREG